MRFSTVFILLLQLYNVDMIYKNSIDTIDFNLLLRELLLFSNNFLILAPRAPKMTKIKPPLGPLIISLIDIAKGMLALLFHLFFVTVLQLLQYKAGKIH